MKPCSCAVAASALLLAATACAPGVSGGSGSLEGEGAFPVKAAYFQLSTIPADPSGRYGETPVADVNLLGSAMTCEQYRKRGVSGLFADGLVEVYSSGHSIAPGTFPLAQPPYLYPTSPYVIVIDRQGNWQKGELVIDSVGDDRLTGSFQAHDEFPDGGTIHLNGTFDALRCDR